MSRVYHTRVAGSGTDHLAATTCVGATGSNGTATVPDPGGAETVTWFAGSDAPGPAPTDGAPPQVEVVVPVYNEEADLDVSVRRLHAYLHDRFPFTVRVTIADNASTDGTWALACALAEELPGVRAVRLIQKGRGRALHTVWRASDAAVLSYMDVDLSTDLAALLPLVAPLLSGHSDVAIGSRLTRGARVLRGPRRELISRCYNVVLHATLATRFSDAQCGFKAIRADRARLLLPHVVDTGWFFDTELLVLAERCGLRIHEVPVDWVDDPDSRVDIVSTAVADLRGVVRVARGLSSGRIPVAALRERARAQTPGVGWPDRAGASGLPAQAVRFAAVGVASTAAYLVLYLCGRLFWPATAANAVSLVVTTVANTAVNRRFTFAVRGRTHVLRHQFQALAVFAVALVLTTGALALLHATAPDPGRAAELAVLVAANLAATVLRFVLLRGWVFGAYRRQVARPVSTREPSPRSSPPTPPAEPPITSPAAPPTEHVTDTDVSGVTR